MMKYVPERPHKKFRVRIDDHFDTTPEEQVDFRKEFDKTFFDKVAEVERKRSLGIDRRKRPWDRGRG
jgi:hypothetical protein